MRFHTELTAQDVRDAATLAGVSIVNLSEHGSRSRARAFEIAFSGSGRHGGQWGTQDYKAATWDEWGVVLGELFRRDHDARVAGIYEGREHFNWVTRDRFKYDDLPPAARHIQHRWSYDGWNMNVTGKFYVHNCKCGAGIRVMRRGHDFSEISGGVSA